MDNPVRFLVVGLFLGLALPAQASATGGIAAAENPCIAFDMPAKDIILNSEKKVLGHYFRQFPLKITNTDYRRDYYATQYFSPFGEKSKWLPHGGYLRQRPLPQPIMSSGTFKSENATKEVKAAVARGINGFIFDILSMSDLEEELEDLLVAAAAYDSRFMVVLQPDMTSLSNGLDDFITIAQTYNNDSRAYHIDGKLVMSPFYSEKYTPEQWSATLQTLAGQGINVYFYPTFLSLGTSRIAAYGPISEGLGVFGTAAVIDTNYNASVATHAAGKKYMAGVAPQNYRPKSYVFWEVQGSLGYRNSWMGSINGNADWVQLTTWSDFSESSQVMPFEGKNGEQGTGYYNLTGYYASWFLTGTAPTINHDVIYYFYRKMPYNGAAPLAGQTTNIAVATPANTVEILGFLKTAGTLKISLAGTDYTSSVSSGVQSLATSLVAGKPTFSLLRNGSTIISLSGDITAVGMEGLPSGYADLTYWSSSASKDATCKMELN